MKQGKDKRLAMIDAAGVAVCLALSAAVYAVAVRPVLDERAARRQQAVELREREQKASELGATLANRRQTLAQTEQQVATRSLKLHPLAQLNRRLADLTQMSDACELSLDQVEPGTQEPGTHYVSVPIRVTGRGTYTSTTQFLARLHERWPDLAVASLDLSGNPRMAQDQPRFTIQLLWYAAPGR